MIGLPAVAQRRVDPAAVPVTAQAAVAHADAPVVPDASVRGRGVVRTEPKLAHAVAVRPARNAVHPRPKQAPRRKPRPRAAAVNSGHYIRSLRGNKHDLAIMRTLGARDAQRNPADAQHLVLLDIGGQVPGGVFLSTTHRFISYAALTRAVEAYVAGYHQRQRAHAPVVIAIGTNNDLRVSAWRGQQWARALINPVRDHFKHYTDITIAGANDIEPGFSGSPAATRAWLSGYLSSTTAPFVFNGSADGCSWHVANSRCLNGWTSRDLVQMAAFAAPKRTIVLPQIYNSAMAGQWAVLAAAAVHAHVPMHIVGALTENRACGRDPSCPTMPSSRALAQLRTQLHRRHAGGGALPMQVDLDVS